MKILNFTEEDQKKCVIAIGFFDGVHRGHQALLSQCVSQAKERNALPAVLTFSHKTLYKTDNFLQSEEEKIHQIQKQGIQRVYLVDFSEIQTLSCPNFVDNFLKKQCGAIECVVGDNFAFGYQASGNANTLKSLIKTEIVRQIDDKGTSISSTRIRTELQSGNIEKANQLLGHNFSLFGEISHGKGLGRLWSFPTCNLPIDEKQFLPSLGVYVTEVFLGEKKYYGLTNIGVRPTVEKNAIPNCETFILDFSGDIYSAKIQVSFLHYLRKEKRFDDVKSLQSQMKNDEIEARKWIQQSTIN